MKVVLGMWENEANQNRSCLRVTPCIPLVKALKSLMWNKCKKSQADSLEEAGKGTCTNMNLCL